jgi:hypothetical protein
MPQAGRGRKRTPGQVWRRPRARPPSTTGFHPWIP